MLVHHEKVLLALDALTQPHGEMCVGFAPLCEKLETSDRRDVRRIVRLLARKGYAEFYRGLSDDEGEFRGAGYCITPEGRKAVNVLAGAEEVA